ncbi:unnamed protein product [Vicia faba]|uniref:F-box domain-containing protein n=1 Tax=Vicia faba TaxID=3906 RepID=A0AAV1AZP4_VICFA|nr:unnamed protein product [Vicia faba]
MKMIKLGNESEECLNSDIIDDILSRIPAKPLLGMKCISRRWQAIISNPSFIKSQLQKAELLLDGFIVQDGYMLSRQDVKTVTYIPVMSKNEDPPVVHHKVFTFLPEQVVVLASCKGIVCCRSLLPSPNPSLYLCNPLIREWIQFNCPIQSHVTDSIALLYDFEPSRFKLVRVKRCEKEVWEEEEEESQSESEEGSFFFTFELYSSETKTWRKSQETCDCNHDLIKNKGVYIGGVLHWLTEGDKIITFNVEKELCLLISVPVPASQFRSVPEACIGEHEGKLHYVQVSENGLHVWYLDSLEDYFDFKWILKHFKTLEDFEQEHPRRFLNLKKRVSERVIMDTNPWMSPLGFQDGKSLIKVSSELYIYDMKSDKTDHACSFRQLNPQSMSPSTVFPHSLTLVSLNDA